MLSTERESKVAFFSICNVPWLPLTLLPELVKM